MSSRREALMAKFTGRSLERIGRAGLALIELEEGRGTEDLRKELIRDLHTLKGDATVVGLEALAAVAHAAEEMMLAGPTGGTRAGPRTCRAVRGALDLIAQGLRGELGDGAQTAAALEEGQRRLRDSPQQATEDRDRGSAHPIAETPAPIPAESPVPEPDRPEGGRAQERWIQVRASRVEEVCEQLAGFAAEFQALSVRLEAMGRSGTAPLAQLRALVEDASRCRSRLEHVVDAGWSLRLTPIEPTLKELVRHARELAEDQGKRLRVIVRAQGAEVERSVLEELWEPLLHLIRNSVDHGVERPEERGDKNGEARIHLEARPAGSNLSVIVEDDGRGIDPEVIRDTAVARELITRQAAAALSEQEVFDLLFLHGFSTRRSASAVSGRGVGLDIVRSRVEGMGGKVLVSSTPGRGARFELLVPTTITKDRALVVACGGALYGIGAAQVVEVGRLGDYDVREAPGGRVLRFREESIPLRSLAAVLGVSEPAEDISVLVIESGRRHWAFHGAELIGEREVLRRPVDALVNQFGHVAASASLDDGRLVMLISLGALLRRAESSPSAALRAAAPPGITPARRVLVVDDSATIRDLLSEILTEARIEVREAADGRRAMEMLKGDLPDLVLSDLEMPVMDGFELLRQIRGRWPTLPVVMLTTRASIEDRRRATALGANAYLVKSDFDEANLLDTVQRYAGPSA